MNATQVVPVRIHERSFRLLIVGSSAMLKEATSALKALADESETEDAFLERAPSVLAQFQCEITEFLDLTRPSVRPPLVDMLRYAANRRTAEQSWAVIKAVLCDADPAALEVLVHDGHLTFVQELLQDVSRDLDEDASSEIAALRADLPPPYDYLLLGP